MKQTINVINPDAFIKAFEDMNCGKTHIAQFSSKDFEMKQQSTQPLEGYEAPAGFPNCCEGHKSILQIGLQKFVEFPNCCESHKNLNTAKWFKKENYSYLPMKLVTTLAYTWHSISKCIDNPDWYKEITDYIEYTKVSYGQFPDGFGASFGLILYLNNLEKNIEGEKDIPVTKKAKLLNFIRKYSEPTTDIDQTDLNLLIGKYNEWLKIFPFELSYFSHLKQYFEQQMPILNGKGETNIYTGLTGFNIMTKKELISFLTSVTLLIIKEINSLQVFQKNQFINANKVKLEVIMSQRKLEIEELNKSEWEDRKEYIKLLKKWLKGEKRFLNELNLIFVKTEGKVEFINDLITGIRALQKNDTNEACIINVREDKPDKETSFRYWFKNFFTARYKEASITAEEEKGSGRIDLKISHKLFGDKIIEFKGWWNQDKINSAEQVCSYLTDFENDGYIFMINHLKSKDITINYKDIITQPTINFVPNSWMEHKFENTDMVYYESKHKFGVKEKVIYHFIFNAFYSVTNAK